MRGLVADVPASRGNSATVTLADNTTRQKTGSN